MGLYAGLMPCRCKFHGTTCIGRVASGMHRRLPVVLLFAATGHGGRLAVHELDMESLDAYFSRLGN